jgi:membrane-associated phospholipid phosphatase
VGAVLLFSVPKGNEVLFFNSLHRYWLNPFFIYITRAAEWPMVLFIVLVTYFSGYKKGIVFAINLAVVGIVVNACKFLLFSSEVRPAAFFEGKAMLNFVEGLEIFRSYSLPSGHTAIGFAIFFMMSIIYGGKVRSIIFFSVALLIGVSRIYLMQHFFVDVYFGALLAVVLTAVVYLISVKIGWITQRLSVVENAE